MFDKDHTEDDLDIPTEFQHLTHLTYQFHVHPNHMYVVTEIVEVTGMSILKIHDPHNKECEVKQYDRFCFFIKINHSSKMLNVSFKAQNVQGI
jgi:hypothetical protein